MRNKFLIAMALSALLGMLVSASAYAYTFSAFGPATVLTPPTSYDKPGFLYPRAIQLQYQSGTYASANGSMLATFENYTPSSTLAYFPIYKSTDNGKTWTTSPISQVTDTQNGYGLRYQPFLYELPIAIGSMPAGTILLAGNSLPYDKSGHTDIDLYKSNDAGQTWSFVSHIAQGGPAVVGGDPIWEPFLLAYNDGTTNKLICYYSDERDPTNSGQKLVHQVSTDGTTWGSVVNDVVDSNTSGRPGMATVAKMGNGNYIMTYEHGAWGGSWPSTYPVDYKIASNPESFGSATELAVQQADGTAPHGSPYVVWLPNVGPNGAVVVGGDDQNELFINYQNAASGTPWIRMHSTVPTGYSRSFVPMADGTSFFTISTVAQSSGYNNLVVGNQHIADVSNSITSGHWYLINRSSGKYLEVANNSTADGAFVDEYANTGYNCQIWTVQATNNGFYHITNLNSGKYLEVKSALTSNGAAVQQWGNTSNPTQEWRIVDQGDGYVRLYNRNSGKSFDINGSTAAQPPEVQEQDSGATNQEWQLVSAP